MQAQCGDGVIELHLGVGMLRAVQAVCSVLPLIADADHPASYMQVSDTPVGYRSALQREVTDYLQTLYLGHQSSEAVERFAFYERTQHAFAIVQTGELQPYGNFLLRKGVVGTALVP